jgi:hypothetical protein
MEIYQILVPCIAVIFMYVSIKQYVSGKNTFFEMFSWCLIWFFIIAVAIVPDLITVHLAQILGIKSNINAIIFLSLGILFFLQYNLFLTIKRQNKTISELIKKIALENKKDTPK